MGITAKIWPITDDEARACAATPKYVNELFHRIPDSRHALIHRARGLASTLADAAGPELRAIDGASDPTYVMTPAGIAAMLDRKVPSPFHPIVEDFPTEAANRIEVVEIARAAAREHRGLMFCIFEDW